MGMGTVQEVLVAEHEALLRVEGADGGSGQGSGVFPLQGIHGILSKPSHASGYPDMEHCDWQLPIKIHGCGNVMMGGLYTGPFDPRGSSKPRRGEKKAGGSYSGVCEMGKKPTVRS